MVVFCHNQAAINIAKNHVLGYSVENKHQISLSLSLYTHISIKMYMINEHDAVTILDINITGFSHCK